MSRTVAVIKKAKNLMQLDVTQAVESSSASFIAVYEDTHPIRIEHRPQNMF